MIPMTAPLDPNSMCLWWPKIKRLQIPQPRTIILPEPEPGALDQYLFAVADDEPDNIPDCWADYEGRVAAAAESLGYPCFLRTDLASGKHGWERCCFVSNAQALGDHIFAVIENGHLVDMLGLNHHALVVREFLDLWSTFRAPRFGNMPVARERRYFVRDAEVICHHPYWPEDAVADGQPDDPEWRRMLRELNFEWPGEVERLMDYADMVAKAMGDGYWSVDFACGSGGDWYLIDMALGDASWHPDHDV